MKWSAFKGEEYESCLHSELDSFPSKEDAFYHVRDGLTSIYERLALQKTDDHSAMVFVVDSINSKIVVSWYDPKTQHHIGRNMFFFFLKGFHTYLDNGRNFSDQFDDICHFGISLFCMKHIGPIRPKIKVYTKTDLQKRPTLLRF